MKNRKFFITISSFLGIVLMITVISESFSKPSDKKTSTSSKSAREDKTAQPKEETPPILVKAFKVKKTNFEDILPIMGTVKPKAEIVLKFEINGIIKKIYFREGDLIEKGKTIAFLDPKDANLKLRYAESKLSATKTSFESLLKKLEIYKQLFEVGAIIKVKLEEIELEVQSAEFQLDAAKAEKKLAVEEVKKTHLLAPKTGVLGSRKAEEGEFVTPTDEIGSLLDISEVFVEAGIVERDIHKIALKKRANIYVDAYPDKVFEGRIERIHPLVEGKSRTLTLRIKIINPKSLILPGMFSRVDILSVELKDVLLVPSISLIKAAKESFLLPIIPKHTIKEEKEEGTILGEIELRTVKTGYMSSDYTEIKRGIEEGDLIITETQGELSNKAKVRVISTEEAPF